MTLSEFLSETEKDTEFPVKRSQIEFLLPIENGRAILANKVSIERFNKDATPFLKAKVNGNIEPTVVVHYGGKTKNENTAMLPITESVSGELSKLCKNDLVSNIGILNEFYRNEPSGYYTYICTSKGSFKGIYCKKGHDKLPKNIWVSIVDRVKACGFTFDSVVINDDTRKTTICFTYKNIKMFIRQNKDLYFTISLYIGSARLMRTSFHTGLSGVLKTLDKKMLLIKVMTEKAEKVSEKPYDKDRFAGKLKMLGYKGSVPIKGKTIGEAVTDTGNVTEPSLSKDEKLLGLAFLNY